MGTSSAPRGLSSAPRSSPSSAVSAFGVVAVGLALLAGCATGPNPALVEARAAVQEAQNDPAVVEHAPVALREAEQALERAERADDDEEVVHLAYLAEQRAGIAEAEAVARRSQAEIETLGQSREQILLETRTQQVRQLEDQLRELQARQTDRGLVVTFSGEILFDVNRATLKPGAQDQLLRLAEALQQNPNRRVLIEGHTDSTGGSEYNLELSQRRAEAVRNFLMLNGVSPERIRAMGFGETRPVASNDTASGRQQNRRVDVVILEEGQPFPGVAGRY